MSGEPRAGRRVRSAEDDGGSKAVWMFAAIAAVAFVVFLLLTHEDSLTEVVKHFVTAGLEALVLACLVGALSETGMFRNYFERRLRYVIESSQADLREEYRAMAATDFLKRAQDHTLLRRFDKKEIQQIDRAALRSLYREDLPDEVFSLLAAIEASRHLFDVWRSNVDFSLVYTEHQTIPGVYCLEMARRSVFRNFTGTTQLVPMTLQDLSERIAGIRDDELFSLLKLRHGDEDLLSSTRESCEVIGDRILHKYQLQLSIPASEEGGNILNTVETRGWYLKSRPWVVTFFRPIHGFSVALQHPPHITPELYVFGIGGSTDVTDPLPPTFDRPGYSSWSYDGWFMPNQGAVLILAERHGGEAPANGDLGHKLASPVRAKGWEADSNET